MALGLYLPNDGPQRGLLLSEADGSWSAIEVPLPQGTGPANVPAFFSSLWCSDDGSCLATGSWYPDGGGGSGRPLILSYRGGQWTAVEPPLPVDANESETYEQLDAVTCDPVGFCVATGTYLDKFGSYSAVILTSAGGAWVASRAPLPADAYPLQAFIRSIACPIAGECHAVGSYSARHDAPDGLYVNQNGLLLDYTNGSWRAIDAPLPNASPTQPDAKLGPISCSRTQCIAIGNYYSGPTQSNHSPNQAAILTLIDGTWSSVVTPLPANASAGAIPSLSSVACDQDGFCGVTGEYRTTTMSAGFFLSGSAGMWTAVDAPLPPDSATGSSAFVSELSCPELGSCTALGFSRTATGFAVPVIYGLDIDSWSAQKALPPPQTQPPYGLTLEAVACPMAGSCTLVGQYGYFDHQEGLIETEQSGPPPDIPEVQLPALLPLTAVGTVGAAATLTKRRRRRDATSALVNR